MVDPVSGAIAGTIAEINNGLAGMSLADAYNANMDSTYDDVSGISVGVGNWTSNKPAITGDASESIYDSNEDTALEAWTDWMHENPDLVDDTTGGASLGSDAGTINYSLIEKVVELSPVVQAVQPVAVPASLAVLAISKALGVAMDYAELATATKDRLINAAISSGAMMYDKARNLALAWWDGAKLLFPKRTAEAVKDALDEEEIPNSGQEAGGEATSEYITTPLNVGGPFIEMIRPNGTTIYQHTGGSVSTAYSMGSNVYAMLASESPFTYTGSSSGSGTKYTFGGKTFYVAQSYANAQFVASCTPAPVPLPSGTQTGAVGYTILFGTVISAGYPEGTERSGAPIYSVPELPSGGGVATGPSTTEPTVEINLPASNTSTKGTTLDPTSDSDPNRVKELPFPPIPLPIPDTRPSNPDIGLVNPSRVDEEVAKKVDELVEDLANTVDPQPPQSTGLAPLPFMPGVPVIDPETGEPTGETVYPSIVPSSGSGLIHVYNPTPAEFMAFGQWLWVTYADATIDKIWNNPFDGIIGAFELYSTPSTDGTDNIRSGFLVCPTTAKLVRQRYTEINCGTVVVPEFYGNYLDYSPYSQCYIYLPFIGINEVSIDDIVGHAVNIRYRVDAYNGSCIAMIYVAKDGYENLCYQFAGNCGVEVPLAGGSQAAIKAGMMQAEAYARATIQSAQIQKTASIGTGIVNGASAGAGAGAMNPIAGIVGGLLGALAGGTSGYIQGAADYGAAKLNAGAMQEAARVANKSSVQHSGSFGSSHGAMGKKIPFLIIRNPIQVKVVNYNADYGFPAHKRVIIGGCTGYLRVREVNVISAFATNEEKIAIEQTLKEGVYVT